MTKTTGKRFNLKDELEKLYIEIPKALLYEPKYKTNKLTKTKGLSNDAKLLYGILLDRTYLSLYTATEKGDTRYVDENKDIFIYFELAAIEEVLNVGTKKAIATKKELISFNLLEEVRLGQGKDVRLYLNMVETDTDNLKLYTSNFLNKVKEKKKLEETRIAKLREKKKLEETRIANLKENKTTEHVVNTLYCQKDSTSTVKKEVQVLSKRQISNTKDSNTDFSKTDISMYVCNDESQNKTILDLYKNKIGEVSLIAKKELESLEGKLDLDLCELIFINAKNNKKINNLEKYIISKLKGISKKNIKTINEYEADVKSYSEKTYNKNNSKSKTTPDKAPKVKTRFHNINESFRNYTPEELEKGLRDAQKDEFKNTDTQEVDMDAIRERAIDLLQKRIDSDDTMLFKPQVIFKLDAFEYEINEICNELLKK